jgi:DOPA 4,5-dioxygenase
MASERQPYHAHIYYEPKQRPAAQRLLQRLAQSKFVLFAGELRDEPVGPHPKAQFEVHFREDAVPADRCADQGDRTDCARTPVDGR